jgi:Manganese containing catalase
MQYSVQGLNCEDAARKDLFMNIGTEELSHLEDVGTLARLHLAPMRFKREFAEADPPIAIAGGGGVNLFSSMGNRCSVPLKRSNTMNRRLHHGAQLGATAENDPRLSSSCSGSLPRRKMPTSSSIRWSNHCASSSLTDVAHTPLFFSSAGLEFDLSERRPIPGTQERSQILFAFIPTSKTWRWASGCAPRNR